MAGVVGVPGALVGLSQGTKGSKKHHFSSFLVLTFSSLSDSWSTVATLTNGSARNVHRRARCSRALRHLTISAR